MALSEDEQRALDELEAALLHDDPRFAGGLTRSPSRIIVARRGAALGMVGLGGGLLLLVLGISTFFLVSVAGYVMMLIGLLALVGSVRRVETEPARGPRRSPLSGQRLNPYLLAMLDEQERRRQPRTHPAD